MSFLKLELKWGKSKKVPDSADKGFTLIYGWASPNVDPLLNCPYSYVFKISPLARDYAIAGLRSGTRTRRYVFTELFSPNSFRRATDDNRSAADLWNEIIPSETRLATHRIEIGILRKGSGIPRSPFFSDYFCFTPPHPNKKPSDRIAIQIAGFLANQLEESKAFDGAAIGNNRAYWLMCIYAGWKQFRG